MTKPKAAAKAAPVPDNGVINHHYEVVAIDAVKPHPDNPRVGDVQAIGKSVAKNGFYGAVACQLSTGRILAGNHRWEAAKAQGMTEIPVIWLDVNDKTALRILLADNRTSDLGTYEKEALAQLLLDLKAADDLVGSGYDAPDVGAILKELGDGLMAAEAEQGLAITDVVEQDAEGGEVGELPATAISQPGDMWILGEHRLLCGDATKPADVKLLMEGKKAQLVFTDPPYNAAYTGNTEEKLTIENDMMEPAQFVAFLTAAFSAVAAATLATASLYICHGWSMQRAFQNALEAAGFEVRCQIIWAKNRFAWGYARYKYQHEPIFYAHHKGESDAWYGDKTQSTLWQENRAAANRLHPTMKPVELVQRAIANSTRTGELVIDFFGGSGTTLIACEAMNRPCRMMELDPRYCDVILRRWQTLTGKSAVLDGGGTFDAAAPAA